MRKETTLIIIIYLYSSLKSFLKKVELYPFFIIFNEEKINGNGGGSVSIRGCRGNGKREKKQESSAMPSCYEALGPSVKPKPAILCSPTSHVVVAPVSSIPALFLLEVPYDSCQLYAI